MQRACDGVLGWLCLLAVLMACGGRPAGTGSNAADGAALQDAVTSAQSDAAAAQSDAATPDALATTDGYRGPSSLPLSAEITCVVQGAACQTPSVDPGAYGTFRKDYWLPKDQYDEYTEPPLDGGRWQVAGIATASGEATGLTIDGVNADTLLKKPTLAWYHIWPRQVVAGQPIWVALHSQDPQWDTLLNSAGTRSLQVMGSTGPLWQAQLAVRTTTVPITYVTVSEDRLTLLVHLHNAGNSEQSLQGLLVNGRDVLAAQQTCVADRRVLPGQSLLISVPACTPWQDGSPWTVVARFDSGQHAVGVGRVIPPYFPIEYWPQSSDCPLPGGHTETFAAHQAAGFDLGHVFWSKDKCPEGFSVQQAVHPSQPYQPPWYAMLEADQVLKNQLTLQPGHVVRAFLTGDESDGQIWEDDGTPVPWIKAQKARALWQKYLTIPVYNGAKTNGHVGAFAGMTDIQGIDLYVAACAPHITAFGALPPPRAAHDYLKNTRNNHMPLTSWMYAQGLSSTWNKTSAETGDKLHIQPDPQELLLQAYAVLTAGGKGLMWFQTNQTEAAHKPQRWKAIADANRVFHGVRSLVREGDITGMATSTGDALVEAIVSRRAIVVPVVNVGATNTAEMTDVGCLASLTYEENLLHWQLADQSLQVDVTVGRDRSVLDAFEVLPGQVIDAPPSTVLPGRVVRWTGLTVSNSQPVRLLVLAADTALRAEVLAAMQSY